MRRLPRRLALVATGLLGLLASGCASGPVNPSVPLDRQAASAELRSMAADRRPLARPVLVLGGYLDPGPMVGTTAMMMRRCVSNPAWVVPITTTGCGSFEASCAHVRRTLARRLGLESGTTIEVDVVGISMGGLVGRSLRLPATTDDGGPTIVLDRLFTISTPHQGAAMASLPAMDPIARAMRPDSDFLAGLDAEAPADDRTFAYARLGDRIVGTERCAPPGRGVWWVATPAFSLAHIDAHRDPRVLADILRRLRGETPYATDPPAPLPGPTAGGSGSPLAQKTDSI
jgi:hypothetical protein